MRRFLTDMAQKMDPICPTFLHVPPQASYPYITLEPKQTLTGFPWGPRILLLSIKVWSRYAGTREVLKLAAQVENFLQTYASFDISINILQSTLTLLTDGQTRKHTFQLKIRIRGTPDE